jgi:hypothetical protein
MNYNINRIINKEHLFEANRSYFLSDKLITPQYSAMVNKNGSIEIKKGDYFYFTSYNDGYIINLFRSKDIYNIIHTVDTLINTIIHNSDLNKNNDNPIFYECYEEKVRENTLNNLIE